MDTSPEQRLVQLRLQLMELKDDQNRASGNELVEVCLEIDKLILEIRQKQSGSST